MSCDPLTMVYDALWNLLEDFPPFTDQVAPGNRIRLNCKLRDPIKDVLRKADLPEVLIFPAGGLTNIHANSSESRLERTYQVLLTTGDKRVNELHFPLQWHIIQAVAAWPARMGGMTWRGQPFLIDVNLPDTTEGMSDPDQNRNIPGWSSVITIATVLNFNTNQLRQIK